MPNPPLNILTGDFSFSRNRRSLKYAVQVLDGPTAKPVRVITVSVDISGGMPPPVIKQRLTEKVINFIANAYPGQLGMRGVIIGRVDHEI